MKRCYVVLLAAFTSLPVTSLFAQIPIPPANSASYSVAYLSPKNGDLYVPVRSTLIVRLPANYPTPAVSDFTFTVEGSLSGLHSGQIVLSNDDRTIIFKPHSPFSLNEEVIVKFSFVREGNGKPVSYSFHTSEMSEAECREVLAEIRKKEIEETTSASENSVSENASSSHWDTVKVLPCFFHVDSITHPAPGNIFFSATNLFTGAYSFIGILDNRGTPIFTKNVPRGCENFKVLPDNTLSYFGQTASKGGIITGEIYRMDIYGNILDTFRCGNGYTTDYHDFELLPNGHALLLSFDPEYVDMTKVISDSAAKSHAKVIGAIIQEIDKDKNVVFQWRSWDHVNITDATHESFTSSTIDYVHINTAAFDTDGNIIASFRHMDEVMKISRSDTNTIWRWGGKHNQFTFLGDTLQFSHQHNPTRIENGHITLWDNGNYRTLVDTVINGKDTSVNKPFSRAVEFDLDEIHHTATPVWQFKNIPFCIAGGNVQRLPNGNTIMGMGIQTFPAILEVTAEGEKVFQLSLELGAWCYRAYKFPLTMAAVHRTKKDDLNQIRNIYPNPAESSTSIIFSGNIGHAELIITDILGHIVYSTSKIISQPGENTFNLDVRNLQNGVYYSKLSQNGRTSTKVMIVQK